MNNLSLAICTKLKPCRIITHLLALATAFSLFMAAVSAHADQPMKTIALIPFKIHAKKDFQKDLGYIRDGIDQMFYSRLSWPGHVRVIQAGEMTQHSQILENYSGNKLIGEIAKITESDYVLAGSITQLAGSFSLDAKVYDISNKQYLPFHDQSKSQGDLIAKIDRIAAFINQEAFNRSTLTWEKMKQEKIARQNKLRRQNPEHLMNLPKEPEEESPGWKVWKYLF